MGIIALAIIISILIFIKSEDKISASILAVVICGISIFVTSAVTDIIIDNMDEDKVHIRMGIKEIPKVKTDVGDFTFYFGSKSDLYDGVVRYVDRNGKVVLHNVTNTAIRTEESFVELGLSKFNKEKIDAFFRKHRKINAIEITLEPVFDIDKRCWIYSFPSSKIDVDSTFEDFNKIVIVRNDDFELIYYDVEEDTIIEYDSIFDEEPSDLIDDIEPIESDEEDAMTEEIVIRQIDRVKVYDRFVETYPNTIFLYAYVYDHERVRFHINGIEKSFPDDMNIMFLGDEDFQELPLGERDVDNIIGTFTTTGADAAVISVPGYDDILIAKDKDVQYYTLDEAHIEGFITPF